MDVSEHWTIFVECDYTFSNELSNNISGNFLLNIFLETSCSIDYILKTGREKMNNNEKCEEF